MQASLGRPPVPADLPASSLNTRYTPSRLALCGVFVSFKPPSLGGLARLSPQAAYDDWNPGRLGFRCLKYAIFVPTCGRLKLADFFDFFELTTLDILDNFWTMSNQSLQPCLFPAAQKCGKFATPGTLSPRIRGSKNILDFPHRNFIGSVLFGTLQHDALLDSTPILLIIPLALSARRQCLHPRL